MPQTMAPASGNDERSSRRAWRDPLLQYLAENTQSPLDRPPLVRPRLGRVGFVPRGAVDCTLSDVADWFTDGSLHTRLGIARNRSARIAYNLNLFDWRPWGVLNGCRRVTGSAVGGKHPDPGYDGGYVSSQRPGANMGISMVLREPLSTYRAWLWTLDNERDEGVYLTRRPLKVSVD